MILNVSGRTDIVGFYTKWFMNRFHEGFVDVRNPFNPKLVSRIYFSDVDAILFCTKNPLPIENELINIDKPIIFHVTITPYKEDIEPNVISKKDIIESVKRISKIIGKENVVVRYDPIFISEKYPVEYHIKAFEKLCSLLNGYINKIIISFIDNYKNVEKNYKYLNYRNFLEDDFKKIGINFSKIASINNMVVHTCFEKEDLTRVGFVKDECMSKELAYRLTGKIYKEEWKARKEKNCHCVSMVDIGAYNTCFHKCKYCYANYEEEKIRENMLNHDENSSLLIGHINADDIIKVRKK